MYNWTRNDIMKVMEVLIERDCPLHTHPRFRKGFDRERNLFANQIIREANGNVAYRAVDFDIDPMDDAQFWAQLDNTKHSDFIEENAAAAILKMADKLKLLN